MLDNEIDAYLQNTSVTRELPMEALAGYGSSFMKILSIQWPKIENIWTSKQTYIAMANLLHAVKLK
jgi:hypothetical protein